MYKKLLLTVIILMPVLALSFIFLGDSGSSSVPSQTAHKSIYPSRIPATVAQSKIRFIPEEIHLQPDGTVEAEVFLEAFENKITEITVEIAYDPKVFRVVEFKPVDFLAGKEITVNKIDTKNGKVIMSAAIDPLKEQPIMGSDAVMELVLQPIDHAAAASQLKFMPGTKATAEDVTGNALVSMEDTLVRLLRE